MFLVKRVLLAIVVVVLLVVIFFMVMLKKIYTPTQGQKINSYANPQKALLVIDVQEDFSGLKGKEPVPLKNVEKQIAVINRLIDNASSLGWQVVYIRQIFTNNLFTRSIIGRAIEGQRGTELDERIKVVNQNDFTKKISDAFSNPELDKFLTKNQIAELYLTGLDGVYCVYYTALGAKNRSYNVTVVKDAVMSHKSMSEVLKLYEKRGIPVITSQEIIGETNQ